MGNISYIENFEEWRKTFKFHLPIKVRFSETDMFGHMNNGSSFVYFEEARIAFLKHIGMFQKLQLEAGTVPVVGDLQCDYLQQVYFDQELRVYVKVNYVGTSSFDLHYLGLNKDTEVCLTGRGRLVKVSSKAKNTVPLTFEEKQILLVQKNNK